MNVYSETTTGGGVAAPGSRPYVDPNAMGEVDPSSYPAPVDSTGKIRGKSEFLEVAVGGLQRELVVAKGFYFFFFSAFGSLFPLMGVFFKQHGFSPAQTGILTGIRPLVEYISAPLILQFAERRRRTKTLLIGSLLSWILFTFPLGSLMPEPVACLKRVNDSHVQLVAPEAVGVVYGGRTKRGVAAGEDSPLNLEQIIDDSGQGEMEYGNYDYDGNNNNGRRSKRAIRRLPLGVSPGRVDYAIGYVKADNKDWVNPVLSSMVFRKDDVAKAFILMLLLVIMGEGLASPAILLADGAVLSFLGDEATLRYGHQRMFGSVGWGIAMFFMGIALDHSTFPSRKCEALPQEKNYTVCFAIFVVLMGLATLLAWQLPVQEPTIPTIGYPDDLPTIELDEKPQQQQQQYDAYGNPIPSVATTTAAGIHATVFAQTNRRLPEWVTVFRHFKTPNCIAFLFIAWIMGTGMGLIFSFLFWHLQDIGGSPILFGLASVINHISEIFAYFFAPTFIQQLGHVKVLCIGLGCNVLRFLYITVLKNPWWVLPFEFVQGLTHATVWAACCSYLTHNTPPDLRAPAQSTLSFLHHGLGRGFGAVVGGIFVSSWGTVATFRLYGIVCLVGLGVFAFFNFYHKGSGFDMTLPEDPHQYAQEEGAHLAPHGVPGGGPNLSRVASNSKLDEQTSNPFQQQQQNFGGAGGGGQEQQQYFIR